LGHVKEPSSCGSLRAAGKIRMFSFLPLLIEVSRTAWCGVPLEMKEGTIPIWDTKALSIRPRCITLIIIIIIIIIIITLICVKLKSTSVEYL
jgi:hypothetical protein